MCRVRGFTSPDSAHRRGPGIEFLEYLCPAATAGPIRPDERSERPGALADDGPSARCGLSRRVARQRQRSGSSLLDPSSCPTLRSASAAASWSVIPMVMSFNS